VVKRNHMHEFACSTVNGFGNRSDCRLHFEIVVSLCTGLESSARQQDFRGEAELCTSRQYDPKVPSKGRSRMWAHKRFPNHQAKPAAL
jgi:hypothetical protein